MLIVLEIALACAVLCNALFLITERLALMNVTSGVEESQFGLVSFRSCEQCQPAEFNARIQSALRAIPGIKSIGVVSALPFASPTGNAGITLDQAGKQFGGVPHFYGFGPSAISTLGLHPTQGRNFTDVDFQPAALYFFPASADVWITRSLADHLWPNETPLGRSFWMDKFHYRVAGVLAHFVRPNPGQGETGITGADWSVILPLLDSAQTGTYVIHATPTQWPQLMQEIRKTVRQIAPEAILDEEQSRPLAELRHQFFQRDRAMAWLLVLVIMAMLLVTSLGILGLASFWVQQRTKQIGIRRALGATRGQILRYFQTENFLISSLGIALGMLLAYLINQLLMQHYALPRLPLYYLPIGALVLWVLGQAAVFGPARRAAAVPPAIATRSA